ncbi:SRPBCC family protein [Nocardioides sp. ChNu-153]|uniref:SRPBCC family protein n=1 Tax=unclassified Nocardioides TaxID=2615069 RepID=UPI002406BC99|nr:MULTISPECIES: SRPBCC family protein [unclassified Nocardioides]MDF9717666.1 SRPBCC family protein [Nocardioides sp. ChNu-99]MDN7123221.1 SRPBCC family protein [Nocardioides sp. ChNu-153]
MARNERVTTATPEQVWEVLADGWLYPLWVVGASRIRGVDEGWPAVGTRIHHSFGAWPLLIDDATVVKEVEPGTRLRLRARGWPMGEASITITLRPEGTGTRIILEEDAVKGPGTLMPKPLRGVGIGVRNVEGLRRLALLAEGRA